MSDPVRLLVVDGVDDTLAEQIARLDEAFVATGVETLTDTLAALSGDQYDCLLCTGGIEMTDLIEAVETLRDRRPDLPIVVISRKGNERLATDALGVGASDYCAVSGRVNGRRRGRDPRYQ